MTEALEADVCVIGAGFAGLTVAAGASQLGAKTVLFEHRLMGGDCLNFGCVPSKALLAAAKRVQSARENAAFGLGGSPPGVDFAAVMAHVHGVISAIEPNDSQARFEGLGVRVIRDFARFAGPDTVESGAARVRARRIVIATGSSPATPVIPGLDAVPFLTNETLFGNRVLPRHLLIIGGGPIGIEMAQAHRLLGAEVTVLEALARIMPKDDPELVALLADALAAEGLRLRTGVQVRRIEADGAEIALTIAAESGEVRASRPRISWSRPDGAPTSRGSSSRRRGSRSTSAAGSWSTAGSAPATAGSMRWATPLAARNSRTSPAIMRGSSSATRCSGCPPRSTIGRFPGSPTPSRSSRRWASPRRRRARIIRAISRSCAGPTMRTTGLRPSVRPTVLPRC